MTQVLRPAFSLLIFFTLLLGLGYPLTITGLAAVVLPGNAEGSLLRRGNAVIGSTLIGQDFRSDRYFWPRPSATAEAPYNAGASSGTNLGPTSAKLKAMVEAEVTRLRATGIQGELPADAVTASGSGLDPHISPAYARLQIDRIAASRNIPREKAEALVAEVTEMPFLGLIGEPRINVLALNLALDSLKP